MGIRALFRAGLLLSTAVLSLGIAQPTAALSVLTLSGNYGSMTFSDATETGAGAKCIYGSDGHLDRVSVRGAELLADDSTWGTDQQWVGLSFKVQRFYYDPADPFLVPYKTIYTSPVVKKLASDSAPAVFDRRGWDVPAQLGRDIRVVVIANWYRPGSKTEVDGTIKFAVEWYRSTRGTTARFDYRRCHAQF